MRDKYKIRRTDGDSPFNSLVDSVGVPVTYQLYTGIPHEFFGMHAIGPEAAQAQALAARQLVTAFN